MSNRKPSPKGNPCIGCEDEYRCLEPDCCCDRAFWEWLVSMNSAETGSAEKSDK